ncbi:MAG: 50S ribosomal protein L11 methyltransferase [Ancalomicrobiaceae bacterium]|nr:50S ribosomal protein L11 methyltransferase [Ancalomicrobiaceae bacterium]
MPTCQVRFAADRATAKRLADMLEEAFEWEGYPVTREETPPYSGHWTVDTIVFDSDLGEAEAQVREALGAEVPEELTVTLLDDATNWVALSEEIRRPVPVGRFFVHGSHDRGKVPPNARAIEIDAELAFGTGHHATTRVCLAALDRLLTVRRYFRPLDLGTGTGLLAIAIAELQGIKVLATDVDPVAVTIARRNADFNGVGAFVETLTANGMAHRRIRERAPYDLVVANILARPLMRLARPIALALAPKATLILSGLRLSDAARVLAAYRLQGLYLSWSIIEDDWMALVLEKGRGKA